MPSPCESEGSQNDPPEEVLALRDAEMPQLSTILNPQKMLNLLRKTVRPTGEGHYHIYEITDCKVERFRYRKGDRIIVQYQLTLYDQLTKHSKKLWVTGVSRNKLKPVLKRYKRIISSDPWWNSSFSSLVFEPVLYFPDLKLLIQLYPQDHHLPTLPLFLNNHSKIRETLLLSQLGEGWKIMESQLTLMRYRPLQAATFRCAFEAEPPHKKEPLKKIFYFKLFKKDEGLSVFEDLLQLKQVFPSREEGIHVLNALGYSKQLKTLILEEAPGIPLSAFILNGLSIEYTLEKTAKALAEFNLSSCSFLKKQSMEERFHPLEKAIRFIQDVCPEHQEKLHQISFQIQARLKEVTLCPTHLDLKPEHIFIDGERVTFIDLDAVAMSDPVYDIASLIARIVFLSESKQISRRIRNRALRVLKTHYFSQVPRSWKKRLIPNYCCASLKIACYLLQHQEAEAKTRVAHILNKCIQQLSQEER